MKHLFIIPVNGFSDIITNSSSELFVCNTDKSKSMVEEMLVKLVEIHNMRQALKGERLINPEDLFTKMLKVTVAEKDFIDPDYECCYSKGNMIIQSLDDNTIPYALFGDIEDLFNAIRQHLG